MSNHSESTGDVEDNDNIELEPVPEDSTITDQASKQTSDQHTEQEQNTESA